MTRTHKIELWIALIAGMILASAGIYVAKRVGRPITLQGAITAQDTDPRKERPIGDVEIFAEDDLASGVARTDANGYFRMTLPKGVRHGHPITMHFRREGYIPLDLNTFVGDELYIVHMKRVPEKSQTAPGQPEVKVSNVRIRYSIKTQTDANVGSAAKTFEVENKGNVPCKGQHPCSPDGNWKAALGSTTLDAGSGNFFRDVRVSCIAGPCPFTRIESDHPSGTDHVLTVTARDWSDTATFLVEAEVFHPMSADMVHESYPVIFGRTMNFTLPISAEGLSIEADIDGQGVIFPLGPDLYLNWASCTVQVNADQARAFRCELKPGYRFQ